MQTTTAIEGVFQDLRYGARVLLRNPGVTFVAATSLALAIGANTTVFSVAKQLLYDRLAVPRAAGLRLLTWADGPDGGWSANLSYPVYEQLRARNRYFEDLLAFHATAANVTIGMNAERVLIHEVSGNYYRVLGIQPRIGRAIDPRDDAARSETVAVISDDMWARDFNRSPAAIGQSIRINDVPATIVGVNPAGFTGAASTLRSQTPDVMVALGKATLVTPSSDGRDWLADPASRSVNVFGRMPDGVADRAALTALEAQFAAIARRLAPPGAADRAPKLIVRDGSRGLFAQQRTFARPMAVLMVFLFLVLLLACANIATLSLARGARRQREMSMRLALGAGRARIVRHMLVESLLLSAVGGAGGLALAFLARDGVARFPVRFDWPVVAFTALMAVATGLLFGVRPALAAMRLEIAPGVRRRGAVGKPVVGFQIALATLLLIAAGLLIRSLAGLTAVTPGFRTDRLLLAQIVLPQNRYPAGANVVFHQRMEQAIAGIPGVAAVSAAEVAYLGGERLQTSVLLEGETRDAGPDRTEPYNAVGADFFDTLGIPIVAGRAFNSGDTARSRKVAVINRRLAEARFPRQNPIGRRLLVGAYAGYGDVLTGEPLEIVGVCGDTLYSDLREGPAPQLFVPYVQQRQVRRLTYLIRTHTNPEAVVPALRRVVQAADPAVPLVNVRTQEDQIESDLADQRLLVSLTTGFALLALVLAAVGTYGLLAYSVAQRTREIGIRMALGAVPRQMLQMVLIEATSLSAAAIAIGVAGALVLMRFVSSLLFGIAPSDPPTVWGAAASLMIVVVGASWLPARRAARLRPMDALRRE